MTKQKNRDLTDDENIEVPFKIFVITALLVLLIQIIGGLFIVRSLDDWNKRSSFGEMFGAINTLFSGWAFAGIIYAILLQRRELKLQRRELEMTRDELRGQKEQLIEQNKTLRQEKFENTFFQLLRFHNEIVSSIDLDVKVGVVRRGRDCFVMMYHILYQTFKQNLLVYEAKRLEGIDSAYCEFYQRHRADIGHYFRNLYRMVKFVDESEIVNKKFYTGLIRAQLSAHEQLLLFYNCLSRYGFEKFKPLIDKYDLLQNMPLEDLLVTDHVQYYESLKSTDQ
jgi:Putative phage abortive infection protein